MNGDSFGFKRLTADNWLVPDRAWTSVVHGVSCDGEVHMMTANQWMQSVLAFNLLERTPVEVRKLFEVARGCMVYGYFFYPMLTLGSEQLYRVAEAALDYKCQEMGRHKPRESFAGKIKWLESESVLSDKERWDAIRHLRNEASHAKRQTVLAPGMVLGLLGSITAGINSLFCPSSNDEAVQ